MSNEVRKVQQKTLLVNLLFVEFLLDCCTLLDHDKHSMKVILSGLAVLLTHFASAQNILTVLGQQDGVSLFTDMLSQYSDLVDYLNTGVHTRK